MVPGSSVLALSVTRMRSLRPCEFAGTVGFPVMARQVLLVPVALMRASVASRVAVCRSPISPSFSATRSPSCRTDSLLVATSLTRSDGRPSRVSSSVFAAASDVVGDGRAKARTGVAWPPPVGAGFHVRSPYRTVVESAVPLPILLAGSRLVFGEMAQE